MNKQIKQVRKITRGEEASFPPFKSHAEARVWFKERYGQEFTLVSVEGKWENRCFLYHLLLNREAYKEGLRALQNGSMSGQPVLRFLNSHQPVEIMENGNIHVIY